MPKPILNLTHPAILEELWESATFDKEVYKLLERYTQAQESGELSKNTPKIQKLTHDIYHHLTTTRNRNLITDAQQAVLRKAVGGFFGMSTGSHAVTTWMMESRADAVKIVDPDHISPSNLNRMRFGWNTVGRDKVAVVCEELEKISPYSQVIATTKTDSQTTQSLFTQKPKLNFVVEAIDDLPAKVNLRLLAKKHRLPLIMATDVGDNVILDIERYDHTPQPELFNGRIKNIDTINFDTLSPHDRIHLAMKIVGFDHNSEAMLDSLATIGNKIATWPQLGATAAMAGALITTTLKKILLNEKVASGRYYFSPDATLVKDFNLPPRLKKRQKLIEKIYARFGQP
jgi:tRNA A37 threonylcarbamoyladenosine dehydratase